MNLIKLIVLVIILVIIIIVVLKLCTNKKTVETSEQLKVIICNVAKNYMINNPTLITNNVVNYEELVNNGLIEANSNFDGIAIRVDGDACEYVKKVENKDVTPPTLKLIGEEEIKLYVGTDFEDPGYTAYDDVDGDIADKVVRSGDIDSSKAGTYTITYTVSDNALNTSTQVRTIIYEVFEPNISELDSESPKLKLKGSNPYCMVKGTKYVEQGAYAIDNIDGDITNKIVVKNTITGEKIGVFRLIYKVEDSSGNEAITYRAVIVADDCSKYQVKSDNNEID
ncbi:MAG: DUF5011 domain-containing protein [Bacilli bacterium]|nr:DUF5011 domain-containing protein [Bacilli bacterium]